MIPLLSSSHPHNFAALLYMREFTSEVRTSFIMRGSNICVFLHTPVTLPRPTLSKCSQRWLEWQTSYQTPTICKLKYKKLVDVFGTGCVLRRHPNTRQQRLVQRIQYWSQTHLSSKLSSFTYWERKNWNLSFLICKISIVISTSQDIYGLNEIA